MKSIASFIAIMLASMVSVFGQTIWNIDNAHSKVKFAVTHLVISEVEGSFRVYSGSIRSANPDFGNATVEFSVDVNSIDTENEMRDKHLKADDFFSAAQYPKMTFKSVSWKKIDGRNSILEGDLTIRDVTRRVPFKVTFGGITKDPYGNTKAGFKAIGVINRFDYGLKWNAVTEAGGAIVGKDVHVILNLQFAAHKSS
jgi:polyisoprenoid-binding protein YceI